MGKNLIDTSLEEGWVDGKYYPGPSFDSFSALGAREAGPAQPEEIVQGAGQSIESDGKSAAEAGAVELHMCQVTGEIAMLAVSSDRTDGSSPERQSHSDEARVLKLRALFESRKAGYKGYALKMLKNANIDPNNLPEGSAPLWKSPKAALDELLANLTPAMHEVIDKDYTTPAIVIEPIMSHEAVYVRDYETRHFDRRVVGRNPFPFRTPFYVSEWAAKDLNKANKRNQVSSTDGQRIVGWRIGVADKAQVTKTLESDGDVNTKTLEDRANDFHGAGGHGTLGFISAIDHPLLYGLMMNQSRDEDARHTIDDIGAINGVWTMGTRVDNSGLRVAGGFWHGAYGKANLYEDSAIDHAGNARVRLAVMFDKVEPADASKIKNPEQVEKELRSLVVEPINALSEAQRTVKGRVRSGEEIARAIPDVAAFLDAVSLRKEGEFFELNAAGQLVIADGCPEAYGLGDDFPTAKMRQSCIWYLDEQGVTQSLQGEDLYTVEEVDGKEFRVWGKIKVLELTKAAKKVVPTMVSGLPTLKFDGVRHKGEYARMNTGQLERSTHTWTDDASLDASRARDAAQDRYNRNVVSDVRVSRAQDGALGSRGVLRVNLNLES